MEFKQDLRIKQTKFDDFCSDEIKTLDETHFTTADEEIDQNIKKKIISLSIEINKLCDIENVHLLSDSIDPLCEYFKDSRISNYCINELIASSSYFHLMNIFGAGNLPEQLEWSLVHFFIDVSYYHPTFNQHFCNHEKAFNYLQNLFIEAPKTKITEISKLMFNIASNCANCFSISYFTHVINRVLSKDEIISNRSSYFLINLFRNGPVEDLEFPPFALHVINRWMWHKSTKTIENLLWCILSWSRRTESFPSIFYETYLFDFVTSQLNKRNELLFRIALSICSTCLITKNDNFLRKIIEKIDFQFLISLFSMPNETSRIVLQFCSNLAACGPFYIDLLLNYGTHVEASVNFESLPFDNKIEIAYFFTACINSGTNEQASCFDSENYIEKLNDMFDMEDNLDLLILHSFIKLQEIKPEIVNYIDQETIEDFILNGFAPDLCRKIKFNAVENM
ncbi:hypothetical protein TRFO_21204 [Tritrichomonas foetus]|uniref:Uncharacterized protein n=1 Tax=Tritrichomonas foetus TaxID=1144522 RepID=A0A1J4KEB8_9EUKA|nr:hypothetical protein TRFO_21204 [Tritrichomonas foetus]|eukprot:OHT09775.1 hypothetical protein TRFO_21204 [Tritrichomonas foetus]